MRKGTETEKIDYDEAIFFTVIVTAPPPECAVSGGYRSGAVGSSPVICTPKVGQKTFGYAYKTWNERKANVCQHAQRRIYC